MDFFASLYEIDSAESSSSSLVASVDIGVEGGGVFDILDSSSISTDSSSSVIYEEQMATNPLRATAEKLAETKHKNDTEELTDANGQTTHINNNVPLAIIGDKGSGKTTMIKALIETIHSVKENGFVSIYYIYTTLSLDLELPEYVVCIDINRAESFLTSLFEIKSIYNSYVVFFDKLQKSRLLDRIDDENDKKLARVLSLADNEIIRYNQEVVNSGADTAAVVDKIIETGERLVKKFSKPFSLDSVRIPAMRKDQRDCIIIDDVAIAGKLLFKSLKDNDIYEYLTLSRHMRLLVIFAGQQVEQLPKPIRREIMTWMFSRNTSLSLLDGVISLNARKRIEEVQGRLKRYEFVVYNAYDDYVGVV